jgi:hypothetical protein
MLTDEIRPHTCLFLLPSLIMLRWFNFINNILVLDIINTVVLFFIRKINFHSLKKYQCCSVKKPIMFLSVTICNFVLGHQTVCSRPTL